MHANMYQEHIFRRKLFKAFQNHPNSLFGMHQVVQNCIIHQRPLICDGPNSLVNIKTDSSILKYQCIFKIDTLEVIFITLKFFYLSMAL